MEKQPIILDTTFVLPLFGIMVDISPTFLTELKSTWNNGIAGYQFYLPSVCLIEVLYKLDREYRKKNTPEILERYSMILPTISISVKSFFHFIENG